jgi:hypothetical protein
MGTKFRGVVCDEHGIGVNDEYCSDSDAKLFRINVLYQASSGEYASRALLFDLEPGMIEAAASGRRSASSSARETS